MALKRVLVAFSCMVLLLCCSILGGVTNRARGGWLSVSYAPWSAHTVLQLVQATPLAVIVLIMALVLAKSRRDRNVKSALTMQRAVLLGIAVLFLTELSLFAGWGAYFSIGSNDQPAIRVRIGIFDWLIGLPQDDATFWQRWSRDFVGMTWRGLFWTAPPGVLFIYYDLGWLPALSGVWMGLIYYFAQFSPHGGHNFEQGIPMAEFEWGMIIWFCTLLPLLRPPQLESSEANEESGLLAHRSNASAARGLEARTDIERRERRNWLLMHIVLVVLECMWLCSAIYYSTTDPYRSAFPDPEHRHDELLGWQRSLVSVWCIWSLSVIMHIICVYRFGWMGETERARQEGDLGYYDPLLPMSQDEQKTNTKKPKSKALQASDSLMLRAAVAAQHSEPIADIVLRGMRDVRIVIEAITIMAFMALIGFTGVVTVMNISHNRA